MHFDRQTTLPLGADSTHAGRDSAAAAGGRLGNTGGTVAAAIRTCGKPEREAAAQSARIGIAEAEFYPHIAITGTIGVAAENASQLFEPTSLQASIGPGFHWNILNYGRIKNNVSAEDARFQQAVINYRDVVLRANEEVENGIIGYLTEQDRLRALDMSTRRRRALGGNRPATVPAGADFVSAAVGFPTGSRGAAGHVDGKPRTGGGRPGGRLQGAGRGVASTIADHVAAPGCRPTVDSRAAAVAELAAKKAGTIGADQLRLGKTPPLVRFRRTLLYLGAIRRHETAGLCGGIVIFPARPRSTSGGVTRGSKKNGEGPPKAWPQEASHAVQNSASQVVFHSA